MARSDLNGDWLIRRNPLEAVSGSDDSEWAENGAATQELFAHANFDKKGPLVASSSFLDY